MSHSDSNEDPVVMAEQIAQDGLKKDKSVGALASTGIIAHTESTPNGPGLPKPNHSDNEQDERADGRGKDAAGSTEIQAGNETGTDISDGATMDHGFNSSDSDGNEAKDAKGHVRSGSVKKPTSFKSVSVTKNFLAKAATAQPIVRPGEKGSTITNGPAPTLTTVATAKPRLVAKLGTGGNGLRAGGPSKLNGASGPDASKVWNKNRPTAPAPPKHFTDEELQKTYGIHLATRLQSDEAGKDPKWADIDDDEDDWAPETVEWMDGTKSSVVTADSQVLPPTPEEKKPSPAVQPVETLKQVPASKPISSTAKTILKPGASAPAQSKPGSLVLKGAPEKPSLVAKPSAPTPAKSPWASLPPVEKVPPVVINPPVQQQPPSSRFQRDPHGFDSLAPPAASPAKEIAADDFSRSWRDDRGSKELYNSQSGRYEPVADGARRNSRQDHSYRQQPAVLQRPPHSQQQGGGPAEPSSAFQTSRLTGTEPASWTDRRRRASSNLSAGSGRRPSIARLQDLPVRVDGLPPVNSVAVESPKQAFATTERSSHGSQGPLTRTSSSAANEGDAVGEIPPSSSSANGAVPYEETVARQQRLMREKIERAKLAKQREKEKEAEEHAARQERLKQKLAALAASNPGPESKEASKKSNAEVVKSPPQPKPALATAPPKPPMPTAEGEVAQYGSIKVHPSHPVKKPGMADVPATNKQTLDTQNIRQPMSPRKQVTRPTNQDAQHVEAGKMPKRLPDPTSEKIPGGSWKSSNAPTEIPTWPKNTSMPAHSMPGSSVWGPPSSNKALGNGTFESHPPFNHNTFDNRQNLHNRTPGMSVVHGPIAPPQQHKSPLVGQSVSSSSFNNSNFSHRSYQNPQTSQSTAPSNQPNPHINQSNIQPTSDTMGNQTAFRDTAPQGTPAAWGVFRATTGLKEKAIADAWVEQEKLKQSLSPEAAALLAEKESASAGPKMPNIRSTTRSTKTEIIEILTVDGKVVQEKRYPPGHQFPRGHNAAQEYRTQWLVDHAPAPPANASAATEVSTTAPLPAAPKSRYFGKEKEEATGDAQVEIDFEAPPPPEDHDHPAYVGDAAKPVVSIPRKVTVNLPGKVAQIASSPAAAATPILDKIGNLLKEDRLKSVKPASKDALEEAPAAAVIALPGKLAAAFQQAEQVTEWSATKPTDEDLFEPPAFASKPVVSISKVSHFNHQFGYQHELDFLVSWKQEVLDVSTVDGEDELYARDLKQMNRVWIRIPGTNKGTFAMQPPPGSPPRSNSRRAVPAKSSSYAAKNNTSTGARKSPPHFGGPQSTQKPRNSSTWNSSHPRAGTSGWANSKRPSVGAQ
ncbi:hypothetical protein E2P81_ATG03786 [Venturia nashicola]|uniref:Uncharacterized protein n=1 Tax=Venturia nashicola TaxID=86259 RepID=A0A4Z1PES1_9PEZI|nr:hypothetical protein E6O75_ATG03872 [Venturia nashicola]TLD38111.1 hypothetical protein E2P81_ATG03786 [Venturia nashicola]